MRTAAERFFHGLAASALVLSSVALAQDKPANYPARPIRLVVTVAPGAGADTMARAAAQMLTDRLGQSVVVDNRAEGSGVIGTELVARAAPDNVKLN